MSLAFSCAEAFGSANWNYLISKSSMLLFLLSVGVSLGTNAALGCFMWRGVIILPWSMLLCS